MNPPPAWSPADMPAVGASARIAEFVATWPADALDDAALHTGRRALLDTYAAAVAGSREPAAALVMRYAGSMVSAPTAMVWTSGRALSIEAAALVNGTIGHLADYDDVTSPMRGHPSVVLLPALASLAASEGSTVRQVFAAFAVGMEVIARLGRVVAVGHVGRGWHSTQTLGVIGAAAACCHLIAADRATTISALGLAVAQAAGTRANFGAMAKAFQAGQAAAAALRATGLARLGFTAGADALDGPSGFVRLYCGGEALAPALADMGHTLLEIHRSGLDVKLYPNCYATHRAVQAMLSLRREHGIGPDDVAAVEVVTSAAAQAPLVFARPRTGLEGKFSMQYAMAAALIDGAVTLASFTDRQVARPAVQALLPRVTTTEADGAPLPRWARVTVRLRAGSGGSRAGASVSRTVETLDGSAAAPVPDHRLIAKLTACLTHAGSAIDGERVGHGLLSLSPDARFATAFRDVLWPRR